MNYLTQTSLMSHVQALSGVVGPRPAGERGELHARQYLRHALGDAGMRSTVREETFSAPGTRGYGVILPALLALGGGMLAQRARLPGAMASAFAAYALHRVYNGRRHPLVRVLPGKDSGNLIVRMYPHGKVRRRVVLLAHIDSPKQRPTFSPNFKHYLRGLATTSVALSAVNSIAGLFGWRRLRTLSSLAIASGVAIAALDETGAYTAGANDNASGMACVLGLGAHLFNNPLQHTEIWLAFTGAKESGLFGIEHLLNRYRVPLADAWFINFEMVGVGDLAYITHHTGLSNLSGYAPDPESLALAVETARSNPQYGVRGVPLTILDEVAPLRARGFRGLTLAGVGADGWLAHWNQASDIADNIKPANLENAARFALAMIERLDERP